MFFAGVGSERQPDLRGARGRLSGNGQPVPGVAVRKQTHYLRGHHLHWSPAPAQSDTRRQPVGVWPCPLLDEAAVHHVDRV